jgi:hypothetical protein
VVIGKTKLRNTVADMPEVQAPNLFGNFLAGRQAYQGEQQQAFQNQMAQRQAQMQEAEFQQQQEAMARQQQFNQLAAQYLGPNDVQMAGGLPQGAVGTDAGPPMQQQQAPASFSQLVALDPQRAFQIRQAVAAEQEAAQAKRVDQAKQGIIQAQYVLRSQSPAALLKVGFPEIAKQIEAEGVDLDDLDDDTVRQYATNVIETLGPIAGVGPAGAGDQFTLGEGQTRFDAQRTASIASVAKSETDKDPSDKKFTRANVLRDEFTAITKDYGTVKQSYDTIKTVASQPSAAGDLSLVFAYMKMLDPQSSVRESEQASASNAAGVPERIRTQWNKLVNGESLSTAQRADFVNQAGNVLQSRQTQFDKTRNKYTTLAKRADLDPIDVVGEEETVVTDTPPQAGAAPTAEAVRVTSIADAMKLPKGTVFITPDGRRKVR